VELAWVGGCVNGVDGDRVVLRVHPTQPPPTQPPPPSWLGLGALVGRFDVGDVDVGDADVGDKVVGNANWF